MSPIKMNCNNFADPLTFPLVSSSGQNLHFHCFGLWTKTDIPISPSCTAQQTKTVNKHYTCLSSACPVVVAHMSAWATYMAAVPDKAGPSVCEIRPSQSLYWEATDTDPVHQTSVSPVMMWVPDLVNRENSGCNSKSFYIESKRPCTMWSHEVVSIPHLKRFCEAYCISFYNVIFWVLDVKDSHPHHHGNNNITRHEMFTL